MNYNEGLDHMPSKCLMLIMSSAVWFVVSVRNACDLLLINVGKGAPNAGS